MDCVVGILVPRLLEFGFKVYTLRTTARKTNRDRIYQKLSVL